MKFLMMSQRLLCSIFKPVKENAALFLFMYALGLVCTYAVVPDKKGYHAWSLSPYELFVDVTIIALIAKLLPEKVSLWFKRLVYFVAYLLAIIDVYCFVKFDTTITPTMLLLIGETNGDEASEFLSSYLSLDLLTSRLGIVLSVIVIHIVWAVVWHYRDVLKKRMNQRIQVANKVKGINLFLCPLFSIPFWTFFVYSLSVSIDNKTAYIRLLSYDNIGSVEHELTRKDRAVQYQPIHRLVFSIYANNLTSKQLKRLIDNIDDVKVDSCSYTSKNIVLIIGESYNRHHASLYGYDKKTTPRQDKRARGRTLVPFSDVVCPWNLTSFVFKHLFSLYTVGDKGEWCDYPLFPELFRKAGYHVTFVTNQFLPQAKEAVYDFSGGFFLNNPQLSKAMFDTRNKSLFRFDAGLICDFDKIRPEQEERNLVIFHLKGQHVDYRTRFPLERRKFVPEDYDRSDLKQKELRVLADYDNATLYNDSIVDAIIKRFDKQEAIVIYVPDHGEECYGEGVHFYGRMHSAEITQRLAHEEFEIPFWIWCSKKYRMAHPEVWRRIQKSKHKPYMTDALAHLLLYLGGVHTPYYKEQLNVLSPSYDEDRPRLLKNITDYNIIRNDAKK